MWSDPINRGRSTDNASGPFLLRALFDQAEHEEQVACHEVHLYFSSHGRCFAEGRSPGRFSGSRPLAPGAPFISRLGRDHAPFPFAIGGRACSEPISITNHLLSNIWWR